MGYWYRVQTVAAATIRETWTIRSRAPLEAAEIDQVIGGTAAAPGVTVACVEDEMIVDEFDRRVTNVRRIGICGES